MRKFWYALLSSLLLGIASPTQAAIALVASTASASPSGGGSTTTIAINTTGANLIVVCVASLPSGQTLSDSKSNTWTALTSHGGSFISQCFYSASPTVGSGHTFTMTSSGGFTFPGLAVMAFSGAASSPFDRQNGTASSSTGTTVQPGSITPANDNELVITGLLYNTSTTTSIDSGFSTPINNGFPSNNFGVAMSYLIQTSATAENPTWTVGSSTTLAASVAAFRIPAPPSAQDALMSSFP